MIARGFKPVVWVGAVGAAALCCYMLSLRVASERADLGRLQARIVSTQQQIRALQTEVGTRGRLAQLEQWNDEVLALAPPGSGQFVQGAQLARFETHDTSVLDGQAQVQVASADAAPPPPTPAAPAAAAPPQAQHAVAAAPAIQPQAPLRTATVQRTSLTTLPAPAPAPARTAPAPAHAQVAHAAPPRAPAPHAQPAAPRIAAATPARNNAHAAPVRTAAANARPATPAPPHPAAPVRTRTAAATPAPRAGQAARGAALLDDRTLREIGSAARAERAGKRN